MPVDQDPIRSASPILKRALGMALLVILASCGTHGADDPEKEGRAMEKAAQPTLRLASDAFRQGGPIPTRYTCDGANTAPQLEWGSPPPGTKSFALVVIDPDAPGGMVRHWGVYDIPAVARAIGGAQHTGTEVRNDFGTLGYGGPCPPKGHGPHHYHFRLFALGREHLDLGADATVASIERAVADALAEGELVGTYERR